MNKKIRDFIYTFGANILNFLMGFITGFLIPGFLDVDNYAYIKLFGFYAGYVGILHLGFLDGIYLKYGSYDYGELPKEKFRGYVRFMFLFQLVESVIMAIGIFIFSKEYNRSIVFYYVVANIVILNLTTMFAFIHQFTKRFKLYSINMVFTKLFYVVGCVLFIFFNIKGYNEFIIMQTIVNLIILIIYLYFNKEIVFGHSDSILANFKEYEYLIKSGFFVMIGNLMTQLVLGIDRFFVDKFFAINDFAMYSFAYTLISLFSILLGSITMVVYPYLARAKKENFNNVYEKSRILITILMAITMSSYFLIKVIVIKFLPKYTDSFGILLFLVPTVLYSAQISILISNFYKVLKETKDYTKNNIIALILSIVTNVIGIIIYKDVITISIATLVAFILWVAYSDYYFKKKLSIHILKSQLLDIYVVIVFLICAIFLNWLLGLIIYLFFIGIYIIIKHREDIKEMFNIIKKR